MFEVDAGDGVVVTAAFGEEWGGELLVEGEEVLDALALAREGLRATAEGCAHSAMIALYSPSSTSWRTSSTRMKS